MPGEGLGHAQCKRLPGVNPSSPAAFKPPARAHSWDTGTDSAHNASVGNLGSCNSMLRNGSRDLVETLHWPVSLAGEYSVRRGRGKGCPPPKKKQVNNR